MKICGLQKTTLIDYPGKIACTIFLYGCNFRCGFCYNADLVTEEPNGSFSEEEILNFLKERHDKLDAVCITGGEPLLTLDYDFLREIKKMGYLVKIDTNGSNLDKLKELVKEGLVDFVAMDIKNNKQNYSKTAGVNVDIKEIEESIKFIANLPKYEFRTTVVLDLHNMQTIKDIAFWLNDLIGKKPKNYFLQGFKSDGNFINPKYTNEINTPEKVLLEMRNSIKMYCENVAIRY